MRQAQFVTALLGQVLGEQPTMTRPSDAAKAIGIPAGQAKDWARLMLDSSPVKAAIHARLTSEVESMAATPTRWLAEVAKLALVEPPTIRDFYLTDGTLKHPTDWSEAMAAEVAELQVEEIWDGRGEEREFKGYAKKVKLHPRKQTKTQALEMLAKYHKLIVQTLEVVGKDGKDLFPAGQDAQDKRARERRASLLAALGPVGPEVAVGLH